MDLKDVSPIISSSIRSSDMNYFFFSLFCQVNFEFYCFTKCKTVTLHKHCCEVGHQVYQATFSLV